MTGSNGGGYVVGGGAGGGWTIKASDLIDPNTMIVANTNWDAIIPQYVDNYGRFYQDPRRMPMEEQVRYWESMAKKENENFKSLKDRQDDIAAILDEHMEEDGSFADAGEALAEIAQLILGKPPKP